MLAIATLFGLAVFWLMPNVKGLMFGLLLAAIYVFAPKIGLNITYEGFITALLYYGIYAGFLAFLKYKAGVPILGKF